MVWHVDYQSHVVIGQWVSLLLMYARKLQTLQLDMAEFACLSAILLFTQGKKLLECDVFLVWRYFKECVIRDLKTL